MFGVCVRTRRPQGTGGQTTNLWMKVEPLWHLTHTLWGHTLKENHQRRRGLCCEARHTSVSWLAADETCNPSGGGHTRLRFWVTGYSTTVCPPPPSCHKQSFFFLYWKWKGWRKKKQPSKNTWGEEAEWQLLENSHLDMGTSKCSIGPFDSLLLLTGDNCFEGPLLSPILRYLAGALNDPFKCYRP